MKAMTTRTMMVKKISVMNLSLSIVVINTMLILTSSGLSFDKQNSSPLLLNINEKHQSQHGIGGISTTDMTQSSEPNVDDKIMASSNTETRRNLDKLKHDDMHYDAINTASQPKDTPEPLPLKQTMTMLTIQSNDKSTKTSEATTIPNILEKLEQNTISDTLSILNSESPEIYECGSHENLQKGHFSGYDYAIVLGMLIISLGIGVFYAYFHKSSGSSSSNDFLLGHEMSVFPVTLSLTTSFITAIELLGNPSEMFYQGTQFCLIVIPMILVIPVAVKIFYPIYYKLDLTSCYEYLGIRFGRDLRIMGALLYIIQMSFYTAVAVLAPAIALSKATGLNTRLAVALIYLVCIFYSSQGGMKAVVIADTFQACVLAGSLVLIIILGSFYSGGITEVFEKASERNRLEFFNFDPNPTSRHTVFSVVIGGFFYWASLFCTNQASVQKCMSLKSLKLAKLALGFAILGLIVVFLINFYTGLMVFTHYADCDPMSSGQIEATDQLLPFYIMDVYEHIYTITGIFVAGIFAASLGTVASALNSLSAVTCEDILLNGFNIKIRPEKGALYAKWLSLGYGIFSFVLVFVVEKLGGVLQATLTLNGLIGGVTLGLFVLGIAFKRANAKGAFYGGVIALVLVVYIGVMAQITNVDPKPLSISVKNCNCFINNNIETSTSYPVSLDFVNVTPTTEISTKNILSSLNNEIVYDKNNASGSNNNHQTSNNGNNNPYSHQNHIDDDGLKGINDNTLTKDSNTGFSFSSFYRISYMWYSMIGAILTIVLGLIISIISDAVSKHRILKITQHQQQHQQQQQQFESNLNVSSIVVNTGYHKPSSTKRNENMNSHYVSEKFQMNPPFKSGVDNFALKIDDEK